MFYYYGLAALYVLGLWWCYDVITRFKEDVKIIVEVKDPVRSAVIILFWILTVIIAIVLIKSTVVMINTMISFFS